MKKLFLISVCLGLSICGFAQDWEDDIYYNPNTAKAQTPAQKATQPQGAAIYGGESQTYYYYPESAYQENRDVDEYNRFGGYYQSSVDTIGNAMANSQDFLYTQEIQKYYNPTIVVDNMAVLSDVLGNSYGNVNIIYENGYPTFSPWYSWSYPYYGTTWCWNPYWNWGPTWTWGYAPGWSWYWGWYDPWYAWGPGWGWGPSWGWGGSYWRPSTPRPGNSVNHGWAHNTRPGTGSHRNPGVVNGAGGGTRPGSGINTRPGMSGTNQGTRPGTTVQPGTSYTHRQPGTQYQGTPTNKRPSLDTQVQRPSGTVRPSTSTSRPSMTTTTRPSTTTTRPSTITTRPSTTTTRPSTTTTRPSTTTTRTSTTTRPSTRTPSYNPGSSSHRSSGGFRSGGGTRGGGGGMRGGGGHRR